MFWTEEKLQKRLRELDTFRYRDAIPLTEWAFAEDKGKANGVAHPPRIAGDKTIRLGDRWKGRDLYAWLYKRVEIPAAWKGRTVLGRFDFGKTGYGNNEGFEAMFYLNGKPYQGVDTNHREVFLPPEAAGAEAELCFRLWSGLEGGGVPKEQEHQIKTAELVCLDEETDDLFFTAHALLDTVKVLDKDQPERYQLLKAADRAFLLLDWSEPGSDGFYRSVAAARSALNGELQTVKKFHPVTVRGIGHTHIDVAWLWRLTHTREKSARSFSTVLRLMEKYPEYVFLQTQPQLYDYIKSDYPEIYEQIKTRVAEGRWEAAGAMWLEADCNLAGGESLVRQILYGTRFLREEFGAECGYLWLPDVFGYSWALPQILKKSGIDTFMTTKISWSQYNRMPHDTFKWRGIDGSEVLAHFISTPDPNGNAKHQYLYNGIIDAFSIKGIWDNYRDKALNRHLLFSYGHGDGGGGVNREMLEMRRRLDRMPGLPNVETGRADDYFKQLQETVANTDQYVHTWDGELYLEYHRGTYTSQAYNKLMNRKLELAYREAEWLQVFRGVVQGNWESYPQKQLADGWRFLLRNQFHDIIPGSSITEVYEDSRAEYAEAEAIVRDVWSAGASGLVSAQSGVKEFTVFNSASHTRSDIVQIPVEEEWDSGYWADEQGQKLTAQKTEETWYVIVNRLLPLSCRTIRFEQGKENEAAEVLFSLKGSKLKTPHYDMEWNESGQLTSILDLAAGREVLSSGARGNVLQVFEDKPMKFDAWDIDLYYQEKQREVRNLESVELIGNGKVAAIVRFRWKYSNSTIVQDMKVYAHSRRVDFVTKVDWHERQQLLKAAFPVAVRTTEATYDIQFGNVKRPTHWNTSWDYARFETVGHQWADLSERGYGVSLLNDCKYGHDIKDNMIRLSLIKSAIYPDPHADQGEHRFTYSLLPHSGDWAQGRTAEEAWALNNPLTYMRGRTEQTGKSLLRLSAGHVQIDAVKKAEDENRAVVRLHEYAGTRGEIRLESDYPIASWQECDLMERPIGELERNPSVKFHINPYEIKTFLIDFK